jgi:hypothetical protein
MRTLLSTFACWLLLTGTANAAIVNVTRADDPAGAGNCPTDCSLRQAIGVANPGDTVLLLGDADHTVAHTLTRGELLIDKALTLQGGGRFVSAIDGLNDNNGERLVKVQSATVQFADLRFQNTFQTRDEVASGGATPTLSHNGGAAIFSDGGQVTVDRVVFESNANVFIGGAITARNGTLTVNDADFHAGRSSYGSALFVRGATVTVNRSTVRGGSNSRGAIFLESGTLALTNSTVTGNGQASSAGGGVVNGGGTLTLLNDTLADNLRGSLMTYDNGAVTNASNTLLGEGFGPACMVTGIIGAPPETGVAVTHDDGHNLAADDSCGLTAQTSRANAQLRLAPVADNGGRTPTMALLWGNEAIDAGAGCAPADQRDLPRDAPCDVGAFEAERFGVPEASTVTPPVQIEPYQATVAADVNLIGEAGALRIDLGTSPQDLSFYTMIGVGRIGATTRRNVELQNLSPDTTYYYQAIAFNASGAAVGETRAFTTGPAPPEAYAAEVFDVTDTTASITFKVAPNGHPTTYVVKWTGPNDSGQMGPFDAGSADPVQVTKEITGLKPATTYLFDVIATSQAGGSSGLSGGPQELSTARQIVGTPGSVLHFTDTGTSNECPAEARVDWGDQTPEQISSDIRCTDTGSDWTYTFTAAHTYQQAGHYQVQITYPDSTRRLYAQVARPLATLSVTRTGPGRVTGAGIDCGDDCTETGDGTITLTATPDPGAAFDGWEGACSGTGACTVSLDADRAVTARFSAPQAQVSPTPTASASPSPAPTPTATPTATPEPPIPGKTVVAVPSGTVLIKVKGKYVPLEPGSIPVGSQIDATKGRVTITSIPRPGAAPETATFYGGIFTLTQSGGVTVLKLTGPTPSCGKARASAGKKVKVRRLWGDGKGKFRTSGKYSAATVRGTRWLVEDSCSGTLTRVVSGVVSVRDNVRGKTIVLRAGKRYLAKPRRR